MSLHPLRARCSRASNTLPSPGLDPNCRRLASVSSPPRIADHRINPHAAQHAIPILSISIRYARTGDPCRRAVQIGPVWHGEAICWWRHRGHRDRLHSICSLTLPHLYLLRAPPPGNWRVWYRQQADICGGTCGGQRGSRIRPTSRLERQCTRHCGRIQRWLSTPRRVSPGQQFCDQAELCSSSRTSACGIYQALRIPS